MFTIYIENATSIPGTPAMTFKAVSRRHVGQVEDTAVHILSPTNHEHIDCLGLFYRYNYIVIHHNYPV